MKVYTVIKQGRLRSGSEASGNIVHGLESASSSFSLCGQKPSAKSVGWGAIDEDVNCPLCLKKLENQDVEFIYDDNVDINF